MAESNFMTTAEALFKGLDTFVSSKTVVGDPIKVDDATIIPLMDVTCGLAAGSFAGNAAAKGSGGMGTRMTPVAMLIIQNGAVRMINVKDQDTVTRIMDMVPGFIDRLTGRKVSGNVVESAKKLARDSETIVETEGRANTGSTKI